MEINAMNTASGSNDGLRSLPVLAANIDLHKPVSDEALVATAKTGDESAFEALFRRYRPRIFALALRYLRVREEAEDIVQQTFQKTFLYLNNFEGKSTFSTWLTRIAINEALMRLRRVRAHREVSIDDTNNIEEDGRHFDMPDASPDPEASYLQREEGCILALAMRQLTPQTRSVVELTELQELSAREAAQHTGLSIPAVKARVFHGRRKLRNSIAAVRGLRQLKSHRYRLGSPATIRKSNQLQAY